MRLKLMTLCMALCSLCSTAFAQNVPDYVPTEGLVAWYPFNGNANDESGNGYHCETYGAMLTDDRYGTQSSAFDFDGQGSHLRGAALPFSDLSISLWFNHDSGGYTYTADPNSSAPTGAQLIGQGTAHVPCSWSDFAIGFADAAIGNDDLLAWEKSNAGGCSVQQSSANWPLETETWIHLIAISQGTQVDFFIDGIWVNSVEFVEPFNLTGSVFSIGARYVENCNGGEPCSGPGNAWNGAIDDVGIWNRALTEEEILALYNAPAPMPGCTDSIACNFNADANIENDNCVYPLFGEDCETGGAACGEGTIWDSSLQSCVGFDQCPSDLNDDGIVGINDLLSLLSDFGTECLPETGEFTCGDPMNYHGYDYATVQIGEQCWFAENLRTALYANGDPIPSDIQDSLLWATGGAQTYFLEDSVYLEERGRMYNGHAVLDARGLCPAGWHVPSDGDFIQLEGATGMNEVDWESTAGDRGCSLEIGKTWKSQTGWYPGDEGTDLWGLSVQPSGYFVAWEGFGNAYTNTEFWTSTPYDATQLWRRQVPADSGCLFRGAWQMVVGSAVRCIKDTE